MNWNSKRGVCLLAAIAITVAGALVIGTAVDVIDGKYSDTAKKVEPEQDE